MGRGWPKREGYHWAPWPYHDCGYGFGCPFDLNGGCGLSYRLQGPPLICLSIFSLNTPNPDLFYQYHDSSVPWNSASAIVWWKILDWNLNFSFLLKGTFLLWETNCEDVPEQEEKFCPDNHSIIVDRRSGNTICNFSRLSHGKNGSPTTKSPELLAECRPLGCCILCLVIFWTTGNFPHVNLSKLLGPRPKASVGYQAKVGKWLTRWSCEVFIVWLIPPFLKKKRGWMMKGLMRSERQTNLHLCKGFASFSNSPTLPRN